MILAQLVSPDFLRIRIWNSGENGQEIMNMQLENAWIISFHGFLPKKADIYSYI